MQDERNSNPALGGASTALVCPGRSGQRYRLSPAHGEAMGPDRVYVLVDRGLVRWVGQARDIIEDQASRARFRALGADGAQMFWLAAPADPLKCMTLMWDLEGGHPTIAQDAA